MRGPMYFAAIADGLELKWDCWRRDTGSNCGTDFPVPALISIARLAGLSLACRPTESGRISQPQPPLENQFHGMSIELQLDSRLPSPLRRAYTFHRMGPVASASHTVVNSSGLAEEDE
jgi:hypothetical protein